MKSRQQSAGLLSFILICTGMKNVIAVFDIGKTNKKVILFDQNLKVVFEHEERFPTTTDEDGIECDDIDLINTG